MTTQTVLDSRVESSGTKYGANLNAEAKIAAKRKKNIVGLLICVIIASMTLSYFGRPRPPVLNLVSPRQEMPNYKDHLPDNTALSDRLVKSYGLAMVIVQSPYTQKNLIALDSLRGWARERFQKQPDFLHPVSLPNSDESSSGFIDAASYNLFAGVKYSMEQFVGQFLKTRIADYHASNAYMSFRNAYFELFGVSNDSAILLSRYQSDRAAQGIDTVLWALMWLVASVAGAISIFACKPKARFDAAQRVLANGWLLLSFTYLIGACTENRLTLLVCALLSAAAGVYMRKPFVFATGDGILRLKFISLSFDWIALAYWISYSILCIQLLTWIHMGTLAAPDPVSLLLASFSGNFLQEQVHAKRLITQIVGLSWLVVGIWAASQMSGDAKAASESRERLASL